MNGTRNAWLASLAAAAVALAVEAAPGGIAIERFSAGKTGAHPQAVRIVEAAGQRIIRVDLSSLPKGAKVHRADLRLARSRPLTGLDDEAMAAIRVYPLFGQGDRKRRGRELAIRPPWHDRLDATDAARRWLADKAGPGKVDIQVRDFALWAPQATALDVWYEAAPAKPLPQVTAVRAVHRAGQTFITWREIDDAVGKDQITWGELKKTLDALDAKRQVRYLLFRHGERITADNLQQAECIAEVKPLSCWNVNGRNLERPIDRYIATARELMVGHWNPFWQARMDGKYGQDCPIDRLVIADGQAPLARGTGLYVHTLGPDAKPGQAFYAVLTAIDGTANTKDLTGANALAEPVDETAGAGEPVLQRQLPAMAMFNYKQKRLHYVRWVGPPHVNVPSQYYNWSVGVPEPLGKTVPLELNLHRDGRSYWRTHYRLERDSVVLCPHDFPIPTWWYGYHESYGTLRPWRGGAVHPYTERRLLAFIDWAAKRWPVDRNRVLVTGCRGGAGGSGPLHLAMHHPNVFNLVICGHPLADYAAVCEAKDKRSVAYAEQMQAIWGQAKWNARTDAGRNVWAEHDMIVAAAALPATATVPYFSMSSNHGDAHMRRLYHVMLKKRLGIMAEFWWGGARYVPVSRTGTYPNVIRLDIARDKPLLAFSYPAAIDSVARRTMSDFNRQLRWKDLADKPGRFEVTLQMAGRGAGAADLTLRRPQAFRPAVGKTYAWTNAGGGKGRYAIKQSGDAAVGADGLLTLPGVQFAAEGSRLVIVPK